MAQQFVTVYVVDAFTNEVFSGNPAAVCLLEKDLPDDLKRKIATEMNLSETAFVTLDSEDHDSFKSSTKFGLRWFTPEVEVDLCGHATLATASVIFQKIGNISKTIEFQSRSGILRASQNYGEPPSITLDFPLNHSTLYQSANLQDIVKVAVGDLDVQEIELSTSTKKLILRLADKYSRNDLENLNPSSQQMMAVENSGVIKGIIITLRLNVDKDGYDFCSRYFAPWVGIPEDPVTGSAHTVLASYWHKIYQKKEMRARQCSKRGGDLIVNIVDQRVELTGQTAFVLEGVMRIK